MAPRPGRVVVEHGRAAFERGPRRDSIVEAVKYGFARQRRGGRAALGEPPRFRDRLAEGGLQDARRSGHAPLAEGRPATFDPPDAQRAHGQHRAEQDAR